MEAKDARQSTYPLCVCGQRRYKTVKFFEEYENCSREISRNVTVLKCRECGLARSFPVPKKDYDEKVYQQAYAEQKSIHPHQLLILKQLKKQKPKGRLLDVGCSVGTMIKFAEEMGYGVFGCEISEFASRYARRGGFNVLTGTLEEVSYPEKYFGIIIMNQVLEHIADLKSIFGELRRILKNEGILVIGVPDCGSSLAKYLGAQWIGYQFNAHIWQFTSRSLKKTMRRFKFEVTRTIHEHGYGYQTKNPMKKITLELIRLFQLGDALIIFAKKSGT